MTWSGARGRAPVLVVEPALRRRWRAYASRELGLLWWRKRGFAPVASFADALRGCHERLMSAERAQADRIVIEYGRRAFRAEVVPGLVGRMVFGVAAVLAGVKMGLGLVPLLGLLGAALVTGTTIGRALWRVGWAFRSGRILRALEREYDALIVPLP